MPTILAIDDDPVFQAFLEKTFAGSDYGIITESDPVRGLSLAEEVHPDLIVLDYEMPGMNGLEAYENLQHNPQTAEIPVWMCSSQSEESLVARAYRLGIADYVTKPISAIAFRAKVDRLLKPRPGTRTIGRPAAASTDDRLRRADDHIRQLLPRIPSITGLDVGLVYKPADRVGGDFYDFFTTARDTACMAIGDVTGHGVEAAVIQTMARKLIQVLVRFSESIEHGLHAANAELMQDLPKGQFVAITLAEWYPDAKTLRIYRLGLPHPLIRLADGTVRVVMSGGTILGMHPPERFARFVAAQDLVLNPGDAVLFHSDGAIEATLPTGTDLGFEGLRQMLRDAPNTRAQDIADFLYQDLLQRVGGPVSDDDITFMVLQAK